MCIFLYVNTIHTGLDKQSYFVQHTIIIITDVRYGFRWFKLTSSINTNVLILLLHKIVHNIYIYGWTNQALCDYLTNKTTLYSTKLS